MRPPSHIEFLVEEPSMEVFLRLTVARWMPEIAFEVRMFDGKMSLLRNLPMRLRAYRKILQADDLIIVVVDRDNDDCLDLKAKIDSMAAAAGFFTGSRHLGGDHRFLSRIAIEELEAWYFGGWDSVKTVYPDISLSVSRRPAYRNPDEIRGGTWEAFERVMHQYGYFKEGLRKREAAAAIGKNMNIAANTSPSFRCLFDTLQRLRAA
jgi:hypothetical protein